MTRQRRLRPTTTALIVLTVAVVALVLIIVLLDGGTASGRDHADTGPRRPLEHDTGGSDGPDKGREDRGNGRSGDDGDDPTEVTPANGSRLVDTVCSGDATVTDVGALGSDDIDEASGLAASRTNPGIWWTHNDSGGRPEIYGLDDSGALVAVVRLNGVRAKDWEDIASVVDDEGRERIYIADIGDAIRGAAARDHVTIHVIDAPVDDHDGGNHDGRNTAAARAVAPTVFDVNATTTDLRYADGPRDAEALIVDPDDGALYIIDKGWSMAGDSGLYRVDLSDLTPPGDPSAEVRTVTAERVADLDLPTATLITAADVSPDGSAIALRGYGIEALYRRAPGQTIADALTGERCVGPNVGEQQGEAIAFSADSSSYVTVAEGRGSVLHRVAASTDR